MLSCFSHIQLFAILRTEAHEAPLSMGFSRQEYWSEWVAISSSRGSSWLRDWTRVSRVSRIGRRVLSYWATWEARTVQSLSRVWLFATPWTAAHQASLSITNSRSSPKLMSIESVMPSSHLILCCPLFLLPSIFPSIRVFSNESALRIRWPKHWSFSFNISPFSIKWSWGIFCSVFKSKK